MNSVGEDAFLASRRASSCPLKGMFFIVKGHVLNGGGCGPLLQPLLEREEDACCDKDCNGFMGVSRGLTRVARRLNTNGSKA